jgi:hypothetical protein
MPLPVSVSDEIVLEFNDLFVDLFCGPNQK